MSADIRGFGRPRWRSFESREERAMERLSANDDAFLPNPGPSSDPEPAPRYPEDENAHHEASPERLAKNTKVTPLDEDKHLEDGIEVKET
jgi:hypothetical protein